MAVIGILPSPFHLIITETCMCHSAHHQIHARTSIINPPEFLEYRGVILALNWNSMEASGSLTPVKSGSRKRTAKDLQLVLEVLLPWIGIPTIKIYMLSCMAGTICTCYGRKNSPHGKAQCCLLKNFKE